FAALALASFSFSAFSLSAFSLAAFFSASVCGFAAVFVLDFVLLFVAVFFFFFLAASCSLVATWTTEETSEAGAGATGGAENADVLRTRLAPNPTRRRLRNCMVKVPDLMAPNRLKAG